MDLPGTNSSTSTTDERAAARAFVARCEVRLSTLHRVAVGMPVGGRPARCYGPNTIGLERKGFSEERRAALKQLWRLLHNPKITTSEAVDRARAELAGQPDVEAVLDFMATAKRGVVLARG